MTLLKTLPVLSLVFGLGLPPAADAGGLSKTLSRAAMRKLLRQEAARDAASVVKPLAKPRTVYRYTNRERAVQEVRRGLTPGKHMTSVAEPGRPLSQEAAQRRYGLLDKPEVRETIHLPQAAAGPPGSPQSSLGRRSGRWRDHLAASVAACCHT